LGGQPRRGATTAEKLRGTNVWVPTPERKRPAPGQRPGWGGCGRGSPHPAVGSRGIIPGKFLKTQMLNPAFWWLVRSLVGSRGRVYPNKQQACQGLNQFQNFNFSAVVAPLVVRTKNQSSGNYETCKLHATRHLGQ